MHKSPEVSIVVASHRADYVGGLAAILSTFAGGDIPTEAIIVTDYPPEALSRNYPHIRWIFLDDRSISAKRNRGIALSKGRILAFIDDDCRPSEDWLRKGYSFLQNQIDFAGVEGLTRIASPIETNVSTIRDYKRLEEPGYRTNNIFYRADIVKNINGFDERFTVQREDVDLAFTLLERGHKIGFSKEIQVSHMIRTGEPWDLLKNCWNRRFDPLLYKKHPILYRKHIGSPWSGGILVNGIVIMAALTGFWWRKKSFALSAVFSSLLALKRRGLKNFSLRRFALETIQFAIAPVVLSAALAYGSFRFRKRFFM